MYSWEITQTMKEYEYCLPSNVYIHMTDHSPQINHVAFNPGNSRFEMWDSDGEYWNFEVYYEAA